MNINYKQPQFELFPANSAMMDEINKPKFLLANLTLSIESLVILSILGIMLALFSFSLGVERGKHLSAQVLDERVSAAWNLAPKQPAITAAKTSAKAMPSAAVKPAGNKGVVLKAQPVVLQSKKTAVQPAAVKGVVPTTKTAAVVMPAAAQGSRYTIQFSSNRVRSHAENEAKAIQAKGLKAFLIKKGDFWLVCGGEFTSQQMAQNTMKKFQPKFPKSTIRRF